jgi:hypothetical protein
MGEKGCIITVRAEDVSFVRRKASFETRAPETMRISSVLGS